MSLKKKIVLGFLISASIIAALVVYEFINFVEMRNEITFLELTDTIRSKSLQLRRHEKNFFLYSPQKSSEESKEVHRYIAELDGILKDNLPLDKTGRLLRFEGLLEDYSARFDKIESNLRGLYEALDEVGAAKDGANYAPLVKLTFLERPAEGADFIEKAFALPGGHRLVSGLKEMDSDINGLRKTGEDILSVSKDLDRSAREHVDRAIQLSQRAMLVIFPLFLLVGIGMLFFIISDITMRLRMLTDMVEKTGKGSYPYIPATLMKPGSRDEVGVLIEKFSEMEEELAAREVELGRKNEELLQGRKLAAIGTLASGVAHELNNPLNNIYLSAQVLAKEIKEEYPPAVREVVGDIVGQTARVKRIVGDLLEFARGKEPRKGRVDITGLIRDVFGLISTTTTYGTEGVKFTFRSAAPSMFLEADHDQMERVFINLFTNAVDAMKGRGELSVEAHDDGRSVRITVADNGSGIDAENLDKIFEPFFTTKDKGTGLGLAIVFNIIKKHGGEITVESEKGWGTLFTITLPSGRE